MKKYISAVSPVFILLVLFLVFACDSTTKADEPEITVNDIEFDNSLLSQTTVAVSIDIANSNPVNASLDKLAYDVYFGYEGEWIFLGQGLKREMLIEKESTSRLLITTMVTDRRILEPMMSLFIEGQPCRIRIDGAGWFQVGLAYFQIPFDKQVPVTSKLQ